MPFTPQATDAVFDGLLQMFDKKNAKKLPAIKDEELQAAASMLMMVERPAREKEDPASEIPPEIAEQVVHQFMDRQYRETLDQPVGMLGNKTPRQAAKSAAGRQKIAEWLKYLENQSLRQPDQADPMATYSFEWMWAELGVSDLRQ